MIECDGNWDSQIRWTKKAGQAVSSGEYEPDGQLHVCPYPQEEIHGTHIDEHGTPREWSGGTCTSGAADKERFAIEFTRPAGNGATYQYKGNGRVLNQGRGPAFIYGTVTVTADEAAPNNGDTGAWDAGRLRGPSLRPGPGEGGEQGTSQSGTNG
jgi:hypothetical protein